MSKHTPGPWEIINRHFDEEGEAEPKHIKGGVMGIEICYMEHRSVANAIMTYPEWEKYGKSEMQDANARLIAAAPELLEALNEIVCAADGGGWSQIDASFTKARAAIAKATGAKP